MGPKHITASIKSLYNTSTVENFKNSEIKILDPGVFYAARYWQLDKLWTKKEMKAKDWCNFLKKSVQVKGGL